MLVVFLTLLTLVYVYNRDNRVGIASVIYIFIVLIIHAIFYFEVELLNLSYFISDELAYVDFENAHGLDESAKNDRILWFYLHDLVSQSYSAEGLFNKLLSLPLLPLLLLLINRFCNNNTVSLYVFLFCPYILLLMQTALRDVAILFISLLLIYIWCGSKSKNIKVIAQFSFFVFLLFLLRPFAVFILVFSIYIFEFYSNVHNQNFSQKLYLVFLNLFVFFILVGGGYILFQEKVDQYIRTLTYFSENGLWLDENKSDVEPSLTFRYFAYAIIRYITTPLPLSLFERLLSDEVSQYGYVDETFRLLNQIFYYFMIVFISFRFIAKRNFFSGWNSLSIVFFIATVLNSLVYALYFAGGGHSRIKIMLFLLVFIIFSNTLSRMKSVNNVS